MAYPFIIERFLKLQNQYIYWNIGYLILMVLLCIVFYIQHFKVNNNKDLSLDSENHLKFKWFHLLYWIFLSFIPCSLMLGVISYISTDIASIPLFWVIPLSMYLITFIIIFRKKDLISYEFLSKNTTYLLILPLLSIILPAKSFPLLITLFAHLLNFFVLSLICHQTLYHFRPHPKYLTIFYLAISFGGFLASIFNGLIAPNYFNYNYEYFIAMILALFALPKIIKKSDGWVTYIVMVVLLLAPKTNTFDNNHIAFIAVLFLIFLLHKKRTSFIVSLSFLCIFGLKTYLFKNDEILDIQRNFYGMKKVSQKNQFHLLINQSTLHGFQDMMNHHPKGETSYYGVIAPLLKTMTSQIHPMTTTIIGLGTGSMLCQFNPDNIVHMVEIDEQVINIAQNPRFFTYLQKCPAQIDIQQQDGRLFVQSLPDHSQDLIVIDAFSSDAIPVHLLTLEAFKTYQQKLRPQGGILIHITNRHLNLGPVIYANATRLNEILSNAP